MIKEGKINKSCIFLMNYGICTSGRPRPTQGCRADDDDGGGGGDDDDDDDIMHFSSGFVRKAVLFEGSRRMSGAVPQLLNTPSCYVQWQFCRKST
jgi:hypothetical protein